MLEKRDLQNNKIHFIHLMVALGPVPQLSSFPNYAHLKKKSVNVNFLAKTGLIFMNLSLNTDIIRNTHVHVF